MVILALLGAPVALHVVLHDLHGHEEHGAVPAGVGAEEHGPHEHPVVASVPPPEAVPPGDGVRLPGLNAVAASPGDIGRSARNVIAHGALRMDDDVGLQPLLSTFLI